MTRVRSFDVFDTVLTRRVGAPEVVADVLADRLAAQDLLPTRPQVFAAARRRCDGQLIDLLGRHPTLTEIHTAVATALNVPADLVPRWVAAEEDVERELCVALPGARALVAGARAEGDRVVFVSDTPHREEFLRELLEREGLARPEDPLFVSGGTPHSKHRGGLFRHAAEQLRASSYLHSGDNARADVAAARVEGWQATERPQGRLTRYERLLEARSTETDRLTSWLAGASRLARLEAVERGVPAAVAEVASGALGPMLVGYALWVAEQARRRGIQRLYYVARDGEVMLAAARHVLPAVAPDVELRYLYGSRQPWIFGASATSDDTLARWVAVGRDFTARTTLARVGLTPEEAYGLTGHPLTDPATADQPLGPQDRQQLAGLLSNAPLLAHVRKAAERTAEETVAYLRQEGLLDAVPSALVDAGWKGNTSEACDQLLQRAGGATPTHLMLGLIDSDIDLRDNGVDLVPWLFDEQRHGQPRQPVQCFNVLAEILCAGTTGRTLGYRRDGDTIRPVLAAPENGPVLAWGLREMQAVAVRVAELVAERLDASALHVDLRPAVNDVLRAFWVTPTPAEVEAWGSFPWEEETDPPFVPIAQRLTTASVAARLKRGDQRIRSNSSWRAGSAAVSPQPWRGILRARAWQLQNRARLRRVPRRVRLELAARRPG